MAGFSELRTLENLNVSVVPTTGLERDVYYNEQIRLIYKDYNNGISIRLLSDDLTAPTIMYQELEDLINEVNVPTQDIDLLIDLRQLVNDDVDYYTNLIGNAAPSVRIVVASLELL